MMEEYAEREEETIQEARAETEQPVEEIRKMRRGVEEARAERV